MQVAEQIRKNAEDYKDFVKDLVNWEKEIKSKEKQPLKVQKVPQEVPTTKPDKIKAYDYRSWDKYDVVIFN
jgi:hypothetical protein